MARGEALRPDQPHAHIHPGHRVPGQPERGLPAPLHERRHPARPGVAPQHARPIRSRVPKRRQHAPVATRVHQANSCRNSRPCRHQPAHGKAGGTSKSSSMVAPGIGSILMARVGGVLSRTPTATKARLAVCQSVSLSAKGSYRADAATPATGIAAIGCARTAVQPSISATMINPVRTNAIAFIPPRWTPSNATAVNNGIAAASGRFAAASWQAAPARTPGWPAECNPG